MIRETDIKKLERFSKGLSDSEEQQYVYSLFSENEDNPEFKHYILKELRDYVNGNPDEKHELSYLLNRIHHIIHNKENRKRNTVVRKISRWYSAAAAILLIPLLIAGGIWLTKTRDAETVVAESQVTSTIYAPMGSRISFSLPDGTQGWLNSGSSLEYNIPFNSNRDVTLTGEALLEVAQDNAHPFTVNAGNSKVTVLGTKFNMNAYPEDNYIEVVLEEGKVQFDVPGINEPVTMKLHERLVYNKDGIDIRTTDVEKYTAWIEGKLVFRGDPMPEVARRIERWYNVDVELVDKNLEKYVIRGTFEDDSLEEVMKYLSMTSPISYRIIERKVLDDGTYEKKKVLLFRKDL